MGINDETINDTSLLMPQDNELDNVSKVILVQNTDTDVKKDLTAHQKLLIQNSDIAIKTIHDGVRDLADLKDLKNQITSEQVVDKKTVAVAIESFGENLLGNTSINGFTMNKTKTNVAYLLRRITDRISLEQESLRTQCDYFFKDTVEAALAMLSDDRRSSYVDQAKSICKTTHEECVGLIGDVGKITMPLRDVSGSNIDIVACSLSSYRAQDYRQTNSGMDLLYLQDLCEGVLRISSKKEIQAFLCVALGHKPYQKNYITDPTYIFGETIRFSDALQICNNKEVQRHIETIGEELLTIKSTLENIMGLYVSSKNESDDALEEYIVDASPIVTSSISAITANINLLVQLPFFFLSCQKLVKEIV